eukprot:COSAG05_NODE_12789_length_454_cov_1.371831_1_plen_89_part_01
MGKPSQHAREPGDVSRDAACCCVSVRLIEIPSSDLMIGSTGTIEWITANTLQRYTGSGLAERHASDLASNGQFKTSGFRPQDRRCPRQL